MNTVISLFLITLLIIPNYSFSYSFTTFLYIFLDGQIIAIIPFIIPNYFPLLSSIILRGLSLGDCLLHLSRSKSSQWCPSTSSRVAARLPAPGHGPCGPALERGREDPVNISLSPPALSGRCKTVRPNHGRPRIREREGGEGRERGRHKAVRPNRGRPRLLPAGARAQLAGGLRPSAAGVRGPIRARKKEMR